MPGGSPLRLFAVGFAALLAVTLGSCLWYLSAADVLAGGARLWLQPTRVATVSYRGEVFELPLPTDSTLEAETEGCARYLAAGDPSFHESLGPFEYVEQLGAAYMFASDELRLEITTSKRTRYFTQIELRVRPNDRPSSSRSSRSSPSAKSTRSSG